MALREIYFVGLKITYIMVSSVCLKGAVSDWGKINSGVPQGSSTLLYLYCVNNITTKIPFVLDTYCHFKIVVKFKNKLKINGTKCVLDTACIYFVKL